MLSDRQNKFYIRITQLSKAGGIETDEERKYLSIANEAIKNDKNFSEVINTLNRALRVLDLDNYQKGGLTREVKNLFEDLKEVYGEPEIRDIYAEKLSAVPKTVTSYNKTTIIVSIVAVVILGLLYYFFQL